jgi:SOS-response transcriptional repressor LexA
VSPERPRDRVSDVLDVLDALEGGYVLEANTAAMASEGILAGDRVIVREQSTAASGQLILAAVDGEGRLKRYVGGDRVLGLVVGVMGRRA